MKTVTGRVISSKPISLSKAASTLSSFLSTDNGASQALCAYLRRSSASFNELKQLHKELRSSRSNRKHRHHRSEVFSDAEAAVDNPYRSEVSHELSHRIEDSEKKKSLASENRSGKKRRESRDRTEGKPTLSVQSGQESSRAFREDERVDGVRLKDGKTTMASGGNADFEDVVDGKRRGGELKNESEDNPSRRVEMDVESSEDKSTVAVENRRKKHKKKSEGGDGKIRDDERDAGARKSDSKLRISDNNGIGYESKTKIEAAGDLVENNVPRGKGRKKHEDKKDVDDEQDHVKSEGQRRRDIEEGKRADEDNDDGKDHMELPTKKKKKKKREQNADNLQNDSGGTIEKEAVTVLDSRELKRKEGKKRKNQDGEEGGDNGPKDQQSMKRRKGNV